MPLPILGGLLAAGALRYGRNKLDQGMLGSVMDRYTADPLNPEAQARAAGQMGMLGLSENQIQQTMNPYMQPQQDPTTLQKQFEYYQGLPAQLQTELLDYRRAGAQNINLNQGMPGRVLTTQEKTENNLNPEATYQYDKNGMIKSVSKEQFSQPQILSGGFATRMNTASQEIESILSDEDFKPGGIVQNIEEFGIPSMIANFMRSPDGQRYRQAQENWITANLRKESGAAIPTDEIEAERRKWYPVPGDSDEVIAQKARARQDAERSMKKASGGAYEDLEEQADREELEELRKLQGDL